MNPLYEQINEMRSRNKLIKQVIKNKKRTVDDIMMLAMMLIVFGLSFMAGYVFFSGTCVLMLISMMSLIYKEV